MGDGFLTQSAPFSYLGLPALFSNTRAAFTGLTLTFLGLYLLFGFRFLAMLPQRMLSFLASSWRGLMSLLVIPSGTIWLWFTKCRILCFGQCAFLSVAAVVFASAFLFQEWSHYNTASRIILILLTVVDGFTAIALFTMLVVPLRVRREVIGFCIIVSAQLSLNIAFAFLVTNPDFPCHAFGPGPTCKKYQRGLAIGNWVLAGLLILYTACLAMMAYVHRDELDIPYPADANEKGLPHPPKSELLSPKPGSTRSTTANGSLVFHRRDSTSSFGTFRDLRDTRQWNHTESVLTSPAEPSTSSPSYSSGQRPSPTMKELNRAFVFPRQTIPQDVDDNNVVYLAYAPDSPMPTFAEAQLPKEDDEVGSPYYKAGGFVRPARRFSVLFPNPRFSSGISGLPQSPKSSPRPPLAPASNSIQVPDRLPCPLPHSHSAASSSSFVESAGSFTLVTASSTNGKWHRRTASVHLSSRATSNPSSPLPTPGTPLSPRLQFFIDTPPRG